MILLALISTVANSVGDPKEKVVVLIVADIAFLDFFNKNN